MVSPSYQETTPGIRMLLGLPLLAVLSVVTQAPDPSRPAADPPAPPAAKRITATRAALPPVIDGRDDDAVWRRATPITQFLEWRPSEGLAPKLPTEAKV